jgi:hypothetical protein
MTCHPIHFRMSQVLTRPERQYRSWYGLPPTPEIAAWDPDHELGGWFKKCDTDSLQ